MQPQGRYFSAFGGLTGRLHLKTMLVVLGASMILGVSSPGAQSTELQGPSPIAEASTPQSLVRELRDSFRKGDYAAASRLLDGAEMEAAVDQDLARRLRVVLDRSLFLNPDLFSDQPSGDLEDGLPPQFERLGTIRTAQGEVVLLAERRTPTSGGWLVAASTVVRIPELYHEFGYGLLGEVLPEVFFRWDILNIQLWQWIGLVAFVLLALALSWVVSVAAYQIGKRLVSRTETQLDDRILLLAIRPARLGLALVLFSIGTLLLRLPLQAQGVLTYLQKGLAIILATWFVLRLVSFAGEALREHLEAQDRQDVLAVVPLGERTAKVVIVVLAGIAVLQNLGFNVSGLLAGLGVGGIALALAAQKSIENLFGGVMIVADRPIRVGDFCRFGDKVGTVEDIGLRSTRVRTLDRTLVSVPNADFSQAQVENFAARDKVRLYVVLNLRYETSPDQLRYVLAELRRLLVAHPKIAADPVRVRFIALGSHSLDVEVVSFVETQEWPEFLAVREDILLRIMDVVEASGTGFAFPSQTLYLGRDGGLDTARSGDAEAAVADWRSRNELPFPDLGTEAVAAAENTLDYPPRGSSSPQPGEAPGPAPGQRENRGAKTPG